MIRTYREVAQYAYDAGFRGVGLVTAVAIARAESGFNDQAVGDVNLTEPGEQSTGLWQVNWRPSRDQIGGLRDPALNLDPAFNARAAFAISGQGHTFTPWSTFTSNAFLAYTGLASIAAQEVSQMPETPEIPPKLIAAFPAGSDGYILIAEDGAVYTFGDATYHGGLQSDGAGHWVIRS